MSDKPYEPEIGQAVFGCPYSEHAVSEIGDAAIQSVLHEFNRVYGNIRQESCDAGDNAGGEYEIGPVKVRNYYWGEDEAIASLPNLVNTLRPDVEIRWYKYSTRGLSCSRAMSAQDWSEWLYATLAAMREEDHKADPFP